MTETIRVGVIGAAGRMGTAARSAVETAHDLELVAALDRDDDPQELVGAGVHVAVDLSVPDAAPANVAFCIGAGIHAVVGTTGWTDEKLSTVRAQLAKATDVGVLVAPNFALGAVLAMRFAQVAARYFESAEVIELHHPDKVDAPSGTARHTASLIAAARRDAGLGSPPDATTSALVGARGADVDGITVHSVRLRGLLAHEEILFGGQGELLTIRHDSFDRSSFMPGVLLGVRTVASRPGLTVGLAEYLEV